MSQKSNSILFMLGATVFNILLMIVLIFIGLFIFSFIASAFPNLSILPFLMIIMFIGAIFLSFFIYSKVIDYVIVKFKLEEKLGPLFNKKRKKQSRE